MTKNDFTDYQKWTRETALYPKDAALTYCTLGLTSEAGEVAGKLKKFIRGDKELSRDEMSKELGDVLWYLARIADECFIDLADVAKINQGKLKSRKQRQTIQGDGDNR